MRVRSAVAVLACLAGCAGGPEDVQDPDGTDLGDVVDAGSDVFEPERQNQCSTDSECFPYRCPGHSEVQGPTCMSRCGDDTDCAEHFRCSLDGFCELQSDPPIVARSCAESPIASPPATELDHWGAYPTTETALTVLLDRDCVDHGDCAFVEGARVSPYHVCEQNRCVPLADASGRCVLGPDVACSSTQHDSGSRFCNLATGRCTQRCKGHSECADDERCAATGSCDGAPELGCVGATTCADCLGDCRRVGGVDICVPASATGLGAPCADDSLDWFDDPASQCGEGLVCIDAACRVDCRVNACDPGFECIVDPVTARQFCAAACAIGEFHCPRGERCVLAGVDAAACQPFPSEPAEEGAPCDPLADACVEGTWCSDFTQTCARLCVDDVECGESGACVAQARRPVSACEIGCSFEQDCGAGVCGRVEWEERSICASTTPTTVWPCRPDQDDCVDGMECMAVGLDAWGCRVPCDAETPCDVGNCNPTPLFLRMGDTRYCDYLTTVSVDRACDPGFASCGDHLTFCVSHLGCTHECASDDDCPEGRRCTRHSDSLAFCFPGVWQ